MNPTRSNLQVLLRRVCLLCWLAGVVLATVFMLVSAVSAIAREHAADTGRITLPADRSLEDPAADNGPLGATALYPSPADRLGFGVARGKVTDYDVAPLKAGWYYDWSLGENPAHPAGLAFAHLLTARNVNWDATKAAVAQATRNDPGALWLIGNEPDNFKMENTFPEVYAETYGRLYRLIKAHDPAAVVAAGGIVMPTELRQQYLKLILDAYQRRYGQPMPVDAWHIHNYVLNEKRGVAPGVPPGICVPYGVMPGFNKHDNLTLFSNQVVAMRQWMADHGYRDKPLIVSEYGILFPQNLGFDYYRVQRFLYDTFDYFLTAVSPTIGYPADANHLVQTWNWFSLDETHFVGGGLTWGALFDPDTYRRLPMGNAWVDYVATRSLTLTVPYSDARPVALRLEPVPAAENGSNPSDEAAASRPFFYDEPSPVRVRAMIANRGNAAMTETVRVALYASVAGGSESLLTSQPVSGLPARYEGSPAWIEATWTAPATATWQLRAVISETGRSLAINRRIDVNLDSLAVSPSTHPKIGPGETAALTLTATVENYGNVGVRNVRVEFWEGGPPGVGRSLGAVTLPELGPLASQEARFVWPGVGMGHYVVWAAASLPAEVPEDDLTNNQTSQKIFAGGQQVYLPLAYRGLCILPCQEEDLVRNGNFETGTLEGWKQAGCNVVLTSSNCYYGQYCVDVGLWSCIGRPDHEISQTLSLPRGSGALLSYAWAVHEADPRPKRIDTLDVEIYSSTGQLLRQVDTLDNRNEDEKWYTSYADLGEFTGQTIQLRFHAHYREPVHTTHFYLDQIRVEVCR